ncbi:hypothetical protein FN846DRAFT_904045 [Sphaerosporella brunnea]|uniref:SAYSvFN domain-containing protein n=1 Tax=Sphaerosporella brunnea TaxID=1250544 RepID=A0A5J5F5C0_9PEZI|nr:hypothetical protein FN846DRAFT_904045 [Sphaerosporella brunnea]
MEQSKEKSKKKTKKPYYIKKADVDLDGYRNEIQERDPAHLLKRAAVAVKTSRQFQLFLAFQAVAVAFGIGQIMLCIGLLWMFYANTGNRKPGEKSAYSLFNENVEAIDGATNLEYLDREMRRQLY